ncbi:NUDIX domain-containing protein [Deinococcus psychrotolerans]|uniref:NUDIX domain-containing protein n=1 Tax=Deinococcus psychrotolerans TaxID=2489213 RepID=A0A3G8YDA6_9DEIO|nr:NUDIX domain-containing protein [Deinococcus psychrotolerans]AZI42965.1 NUDIX domain-containing protein [Deinococcus psychrotolerans]
MNDRPSDSDSAAPPSRPLVCVGALVSGPAGYLIVQTTKWRGSWGVPGGKVEYGETLLAAVEREFVEETGLKITHIRAAQTQEAVRSAEFQKDSHMLLFDFFAQTEDETITPNEEIVQWAWVSLEEALTYPLNSFTRTLVELAIKEGA